MSYEGGYVPGLSRGVDSSVALSAFGFALHAARRPCDTRDSGRIYNESRENNQTQQAVEIKNSRIPLSYTTYHTTLKNNQKVVYTTQIPVNVNSWLSQRDWLILDYMVLAPAGYQS